MTTTRARQVRRPLRGGLLFVHGRVHGPSRDMVLPSGLLSLLSAVPHPVRGLFEAELSDADLRASDVVLMDLHWYHTLHSVVRLAERVRRANPTATVVVGGYTASVFARELVSEASVDVVVRGDADVVLPRLLDALMAGEPWEHLPNLTTRDAHNPLDSVVIPTTFPNPERPWPAWFPTFARVVERYQRTGYPNYAFPFVQVSRGCLYACDKCYGHPAIQRQVCGRAMVLREPAHICRELRAWDADPRVRLVHIAGDLDSPALREHTRAVLSERRDLGLYYEFLNLPEPEALGAFCGAFRKVFCCLSTLTEHGQTAERVDIDRLERLLRHARRWGASATLYVDSTQEARHPGYAREMLRLLRTHHVEMLDTPNWKIDVPRPNADPDLRRAELKRFLHLSRSGTLTERARAAVLHRILASRSATRLGRGIGTAMAASSLAAAAVRPARVEPRP